MSIQDGRLRKLKYDALMNHKPYVLDTVVNSLGQIIELVEHPIDGDLSFVIAIYHKEKIACHTDFFETCDLQSGSDYEVVFRDGNLYHGE